MEKALIAIQLLVGATKKGTAIRDVYGLPLAKLGD